MSNVKTVSELNNFLEQYKNCIDYLRLEEFLYICKDSLYELDFCNCYKSYLKQHYCNNDKCEDIWFIDELNLVECDGDCDRDFNYSIHSFVQILNCQFDFEEPIGEYYNKIFNNSSCELNDFCDFLDIPLAYKRDVDSYDSEEFILESYARCLDEPFSIDSYNNQDNHNYRWFYLLGARNSLDLLRTIVDSEIVDEWYSFVIGEYEEYRNEYYRNLS